MFMPNRVTVRVKDNRLYFFSYSYFLIHFFFLFLGLRVRVSAISHMTVITVTQKNIEDSKTIMLYYISVVYNIYSLQSRLKLM